MRNWYYDMKRAKYTLQTIIRATNICMWGAVRFQYIFVGFLVSKEELLLHIKEATVVIGAKYGARNIAHDAPVCIGCALPRRYLSPNIKFICHIRFIAWFILSPMCHYHLTISQYQMFTSYSIYFLIHAFITFNLSPYIIPQCHSSISFTIFPIIFTFDISPVSEHY